MLATVPSGSETHDITVTGPETTVTVRSLFSGAPVAGVDYSQLTKLRAKIENLAPQEPVPEQLVINWFAKDLYSRWLTVKAGTLIVGQIHKFEHFFVVLSGKCILWDPAAESAIHAAAPYMVISPVGSQRLIFAETDLTLATFHPNISESQDMKSACACDSEAEFRDYLRSL